MLHYYYSWSQLSLSNLISREDVVGQNTTPGPAKVFGTINVRSIKTQSLQKKLLEKTLPVPLTRHQYENNLIMEDQWVNLSCFFSQTVKGCWRVPPSSPPQYIISISRFGLVFCPELLVKVKYKVNQSDQ